MQAIAVPGPLFISEGFDRDRLRDSKTQQLPTGTFLQFPPREEAASDVRRTPPLVRCAVQHAWLARQGFAALPGQTVHAPAFFQKQGCKAAGSWRPLPPPLRMSLG